MSVEAIYLNNIPFGIEAHMLRRHLVENLPDVFKKANDDGCLKIEVYQKNGAVTATVKGFSFQYERLELLFRGMKLTHGNKSLLTNIKPDTGEERNVNGDFKICRPAAFRRDLTMISGDTHRKLLLTFNQDFRDSVGQKIFTGQSKTAFLNTVNFNEDVLLQPGGIEFFNAIQNQRSTIVKFYSEMELLQGIVFLNKNPLLVGHESDFYPKFTTQDRKYSSDCSYMTGIGKDGTVIDIAGLSVSHGYVPFKLLNQEFLDKKVKARLRSLCWRCKSSYKLIGLNLHLNSYAGMCECSYLSNNADKNANKKIAYHWPNEKFTRLVLGSAEHGASDNTIPLIICHYPIKTGYSGVAEYVEIAVPLLEEEWYYTSTDFKKNNTTTGTLLLSKFVEEFGEGRVMYAWKLKVDRSSKAWAPGNPKAIKKVTFMWGQNTRVMDRSQSFEKQFKGKLFKMTALKIPSSSHVGVCFQVIIPKEIKLPDESTIIHIVPKPDKSEYSGIKHSLNTWMKTVPEERPVLMNLLLNPHSSECNGWALQPNTIKTRPFKLSREHRILSVIEEELNTEQRIAMRKAMNHAVSIVCGPPGTGKTVTLASIVITLSVLEEGGILVCSPSNYASDGIAAAIENIVKKFSLKVKVLRIYAKSREIGHLPKENEPFDILHEEVRKCPEWTQDPKLEDILTKVTNNLSFLLTSDEMILYKEHVDRIEKIIMNKYDVFVSTVGALGDKRVESWGKKNLPFTTVILDEAGQLSHDCTINLFNVHPKRIIFGGDPLQLPPTITSYAAQVAGANKSLMEICSWNMSSMEGESTNKLLPPWTTLAIQHRSHPDIRSIFSGMTYGGLLKDTEAVVTRQIKSYYNFLLQKFDGRRVVVLDHRSCETRDCLSYKNIKEAYIIEKLVKEMLHKGIPAEEITVLTFYEAQRQLLETSIDNKLVEVRTVDGFQGREKSVVILSFVRNNNVRRLGFLQDQRRLNVALSRAQNFLILVHNKNFMESMTLQHINLFNKLIKAHSTIFLKFVFTRFNYLWKL